MNDHERRLVNALYELQIELFNHQGDEIEALRKANESLRRSHDTIGKMLEIMRELLPPS